MHNYFFEIYTKGPDGTPGWEIEVGFVFKALDREDAVSKLKAKFRHKFDEVIQLYQTNLFPLKGAVLVR